MSSNMGTGNMGTGNMGIGNAGAGGSGGGGAFFADRVDLPFVTADFAPGSPISQQKIWPPCFPINNWTAEWYSWLVLTQFVCDATWQGWDILPGWAATGGKIDWNSTGAQKKVEGEIKCLVTMARDERSDALAEIISQKDEFLSYFMNLLSVPASHPATVKVLAAASFVAGFCAMYYKGKYHRPRPSMLRPALLPPIAVPGHASLPSGHSTQAHLMALCMTEVLTGTPLLPSMGNDLAALAQRIARNREIAGLHYSSDTEAGVKLAGYAWGVLKQQMADNPTTNWFAIAMAEAQGEWPKYPPAEAAE